MKTNKEARISISKSIAANIEYLTNKDIKEISQFWMHLKKSRGIG